MLVVIEMDLKVKHVFYNPRDKHKIKKVQKTKVKRLMIRELQSPYQLIYEEKG